MGAGYPDVESGGAFGRNHHWQGVARLSGNNDRFLALVSNHDGFGSLAIVEMGSAANAGGRAFGQTREPNRAPPASDRIVAAFTLTTRSDHPGGISALGDLLLVPLSREDRVQVLDVSSPLQPVLAEEVVTGGGTEGEFVAAAMLANGHALMITGACSRGSGCKAEGGLRLHFRLSSRPGTNFGAGTAFSRTFDEDLPHENGTKGGWHEIQNVNLVTDCASGALFLLATTEDEEPHRGWAYLFALQLIGSEAGVSDAQLTMVGKRRLFCAGRDIAFGCNLHAGGGTYVDPDGNLIIYGTEHYNDGPRDSVRMKEFADDGVAVTITP
jgi:hypothetical protein